MTTVLNTMYPPQVDTFMPSFIYNEDAPIYFSISAYNSDAKIKYVHVSMVDQRTNQSVFKGMNGSTAVYPQLYPISWSNVTWDEEKQLYKLYIPSSILKTDYFNVGQFYKVQLRFDLNTNDNPTKYFSTNSGNDSSVKLSQYLTNYTDYFSEWSTATLIKPILIPSLGGLKLEGKDTSQSEFITFEINNNTIQATSTAAAKFSNNTITIDPNNELNLTVTGDGKIASKLLTYLYPTTDCHIYTTMTFNCGEYDDITDSTEILKSYTIQLIKDNTILSESTVSTIDNINEINTTLDLSNVSYGNYTIKITCLTTNNYEAIYEYDIQIIDYKYDTEDVLTIGKVTTDADQELGINYITAQIKNTAIGNQGGMAIIRRASNRTNFTDWELFYSSIILKNGSFSIANMPDYTIESMTGYKYVIQYINSSGEPYRPCYLSTDTPANDIIVNEFYGAILLDSEYKVGLSYNFKISQRTPTVSRTKVDTLGGKYPIFTQNARTKYHQYTISGLISTQDIMPIAEKSSIIGAEMSAVTSANEYADWLYEREYRDILEEWLNNGKPKLFKSMTEGNLIVILDSITLSPNDTLGRRLYSFNATMYEVADHDLDTMESLDIIYRGEE